MTRLINGRYARQILLPQLGESGQHRLLGSRVTLVGCGALGTTIANLLVRAGIGHLRIIDRDFIELNNLHRQSLFCESDVDNNLPKAIAAAARLSQINAECEIEPVVDDLNFKNALELLAGSDVVLDGLDNFHSRYVVNDACVKLNIPWIYGGCVGTNGLVMTIRPGISPCLRCVFPIPAPMGFTQTCDTAGVLNTTAMLVAAYQATETVKLLIHKEQDCLDGLLDLDGWKHETRTVSTQLDPACECCAQKHFPFLEGHGGMELVSLCGREAVQVVRESDVTLDLEEMANQLAPLGEVKRTRFLLKFYVQGLEFTLFRNGRALIMGTSNITIAKNLYAKYIGA